MITVYQLKIQNYNAFDTDTALQNAYAGACITQDKPVIKSILAGNIAGLSYVKVADVDTNDKDFAFERTNSIDDYWGENDGVVEYGSEHRSTSTGDLMFVSGEWFVVASFGFDKLL